MANMNLFMIEGRLTADAEYSTFGQKDTPKSTFTIANNTGYKEYKHTNFFNCEIIGKTAENLHQYLLKGKPVNIQGEIKHERWENQDGQKRSAMKFIVKNLSFTAGDSQQSSNQSQPPQQNAAPQQRQQQKPDQEGFVGGQGGSPKAKSPFAQALENKPPVTQNQGFYKPNQAAGFDYDDVPF
jgi:single-strand DNA-binding protein